MANITKKTLFDALEVCAVKAKHAAVSFVSSLEKMFLIDDVINHNVVARQVRKSAVKATVHPVMTRTAKNALLNKNQRMGSIAYLCRATPRNKSAYVKRDKDRQRSEWKVCELPLHYQRYI